MQHPRILRIIQENNLIFAKKTEPQQQQKEESRSSEPYSVDLDEESEEEEGQQEETMSQSLRQFVVETQESQDIDINIHRRLLNQQRFEESQMPSTQLTHQNDFDDYYSEEESLSESKSSEDDVSKTKTSDFEKLKQLTDPHI